MKKNLLLFMCGAGMLTHAELSAQFTIKNLDLDVQHAGVSAIDIDRDGDLDIVITGESGPNKKTMLYLNDGTGNFTPTASPFAATTRSTFDWGDINQDGKADVITAGFDTANKALPVFILLPVRPLSLHIPV